MTTFTLRSTFASLPRTARGQAIVINGDPKNKNFLYCNGNQVYIRNIQDTSECDVYSEHSKETTVAKYSPSGFYIASGDKEGKVRVWDTVNPEHILKAEHNALGGAIKDIDWTMDNNKLLVVGEGRERFGRAMTFDSGNSAGDIKGHSKAINSVAVKQGRPMRAVTGAEDFCLVFFEGPPFKFKCTKNDHSNFVNCVRYSPDGSKFISGSSDGKLFVYDGATSDLKYELGAPKAHGGGIYAICFSPDGQNLLSVSGDKTAKIWDIEGNTVKTEFVLGKAVTDMQVGCLWQENTLLTVSLSGYINFLDPANPSSPSKIVKGHNKPLSALAISDDGHIYSASSDGLIISWDARTSENDDFKGKGHANQVTDMVLDGGNLVTVSMDDTVRFTQANSLQYGSECVKLDSQPKAVDSKNGIAVVACIGQLVVVGPPQNKLSSLPIQFEPLSVSISPNGAEVAVGSKKNLHIFSLSNNTLKEIKTEAYEDVNAVQYSPDGAFLALSSRNKVFMYDLSSWTEEIKTWGDQHTARVTSLRWSPDSRRFVTASLDTYIICWENGKFRGQKPSTKAHILSYVNRVGWLDNNTLVTAGQDSNLKIWTVSD